MHQVRFHLASAPDSAAFIIHSDIMLLSTNLGFTRITLFLLIIVLFLLLLCCCIIHSFLYYVVLSLLLNVAYFSLAYIQFIVRGVEWFGMVHKPSCKPSQTASVKPAVVLSWNGSRWLTNLLVSHLKELQ